MNCVGTELVDGVLVASMSRPKANALNAELVTEMLEVLSRAEEDEAVRALIVTSAVPGFFCTGLDIKEVFQYDRETMGRFWADFASLYERLYLLPKPTIASLPGHCYAGGIMLALACDLRLMAKGKYGLAVSGINIGMVLPEGVFRMAIQAVGHGQARHLFLTGETFKPKRALRIGFLRELVDLDDLPGKSMEWAKELAGKSPGAYARIKQMSREVVGYTRDSERTDPEAFLERWFSEDSVAWRKTALERLTSP